MDEDISLASDMIDNSLSDILLLLGLTAVVNCSDLRSLLSNGIDGDSRTDTCIDDDLEDTGMSILEGS
jgi:hypothetical protein